MSKRKPAKSNDASMFRRTAVSAKKININPAPYRGGIRL